jgi:hypothetical protein
MAGYSGTPLWKKLGYKAGLRARVENPPANYIGLLQLPAEIRVLWSARIEPGVEFCHLFVTSAGALKRKLPVFRKKIDPAGMVWISWPKKSSEVATDITEDVIRQLALPLGFVDIKVCAVDETWSGLKLVIRKELR